MLPNTLLLQVPEQVNGRLSSTPGKMVLFQKELCFNYVKLMNGSSFSGKGENPRISHLPLSPSALCSGIEGGDLPGPQTPSIRHLPQRALPLRKGKNRRLQAAASMTPRAAGALILQPNEETHAQGWVPRSCLLGQLVGSPSAG